MTAHALVAAAGHLNTRKCRQLERKDARYLAENTLDAAGVQHLRDYCKGQPNPCGTPPCDVIDTACAVKGTEAAPKRQTRAQAEVAAAAAAKDNPPPAKKARPWTRWLGGDDA